MSGMAPPGSARLLQAGTSRVGCRLAFGGRGNHCTLCSGDPCCSAEDAERTSVHCNYCICYTFLLPPEKRKKKKSSCDLTSYVYVIPENVVG